MPLPSVTLLLTAARIGTFEHERPLTKDERRYAVLSARLDDGRRLVYRDVRRLGTLLLLDDRGWRAYDTAIGPEPLDPGFTPDRLLAILRRSRQAVKKVLMDQRHLAGVERLGPDLLESYERDV